MKILKYLGVLSISLLLFSCTKEAMDDVNVDKNSTDKMTAKNLIPDAILKSAYETTSTDLAWYTSVFVEQSAGTWGQLASADKRIGMNSSSTFDNSWNSLYDVMNICYTVIQKTDPTTGEEKDNYVCRGIAEILMAYNLGMATDLWGEVPYDEAFKGLSNLKPAYQNQSVIYPKIQALLTDAIANLKLAGKIPSTLDFTYGGDKTKWIKAAYSLKARYFLRLSQKSATASTDALAAAALGFSSADDEMMFAEYGAGPGSWNPWFEEWYGRSMMSESQTLDNLFTDRNDPRYDWAVLGDVDGAAPNGTAKEQQGGYNVSAFSTNSMDLSSYPTPMMTYHELLFIVAEAKFRNSDPTWTNSLQDAIAASFTYNEKFNAWGDVAYSKTAADYYTDEVLPRLTVGNELKEILTQKYLSEYQFEAIQAYNDYRRTGIPTMNNPKNATVGFVNRLPFAYSEFSNNPANVPTVNIYTDKVWWAGGTESVK